MASDYARALGSRLRAIRQQQGLSLQGVEEKSDGRWKAVVIGSYERGDRAVTVAKLAELAEFYGVPVAELLPGGVAGATHEPPTQIVIDLEQLTRVPAGQGGPAGPVRRSDPDPARRLQRPGPVDPRRRPAHPRGHLRPARRPARRGADRLGSAEPRGPHRGRRAPGAFRRARSCAPASRSSCPERPAARRRRSPPARPCFTRPMASNAVSTCCTRSSV